MASPGGTTIAGIHALEKVSTSTHFPLPGPRPSPFAAELPGPRRRARAEAKGRTSVCEGERASVWPQAGVRAAFMDAVVAATERAKQMSKM